MCARLSELQAYGARCVHHQVLDCEKRRRDLVDTDLRLGGKVILDTQRVQIHTFSESFSAQPQSIGGNCIAKGSLSSAYFYSRSRTDPRVLQAAERVPRLIALHIPAH